MSARYSHKANLLAGGFLIGGVLLAVVTSFVLADISLTRTESYIVRFSLKDGATGLAPDAAVRVGGQQVGKVRNVRVEPDDQGELVVNVEIGVRADIELYEDAWAYLEVPLLGTASTINIPYVGAGELPGAPQGTDARLETGEVLFGSIAPPLFLANAGFGPEQRRQVQTIFADTERALTSLAGAIEELSPQINPVVEDAAATVASARRSAESIETDLVNWRATVGETLDNAESASARLPEVIEDARLVLSDSREMVQSGREILGDNRPRIDNIIANAESIVGSVESEWVPQGSALIADARGGIGTFTETGERVNALVAEQQPGIEKSLANLRVMTDQLKFLAIEARSQPWRLLHRPDTKELENQLLYDSARSYAVAVADLRAASEAIEGVITRAGLTGQVDLATLESMRTKLQEAFEGYASAEEALLDRMIEANAQGSP